MVTMPVLGRVLGLPCQCHAFSAYQVLVAVLPHDMHFASEICIDPEKHSLHTRANAPAPSTVSAGLYWGHSKRSHI